MFENRRLGVILLVFIIGGAILTARLFNLQVSNYSYWKAMAQGQQRFLNQAIGERGNIFVNDKDNRQYKVAAQKEETLVCVSPRELLEQENKESIIAKLEEILSQEKGAIAKKIEAAVNMCEILKLDITGEEISKIEEANIKGVYLKKENRRYYPQDGFLATVLGFVGGEGLGQYGVEGYYDDKLSGQEGFLEKEIGPKINIIRKEAAKGKDLQLTIDYNVQASSEKMLKQAIEQSNAEDGLIIVADPYTGKIIALASLPSFDPNNYRQITDYKLFENSAVQAIYEPGSILKPVIMAAAIDSGKITPETKYTDYGFLKIGGYTIYNYDKRVWGERTMTEVLERSINTGAVFAESQIEHWQFLDYLKKFGLFEKTGIDIQGEVFSENKNLINGKEINFATAAFGQGIAMTPIQLIRAFSAIANGGYLVKPYVNAESEPQISATRIISEKTAGQVREMLVSVIENGYSKSVKIPGYYLAGKTGTAQIPWSDLGINKAGYSEKTNQTFIGFFPAFSPKLLVLVKLNNPETKTAEYSAGPLFKEIAQYLIDYWQIPPDY